MRSLLRRSGPVRKASAFAALALIVALAASCNSFTGNPDAPRAAPDLFDKIRQVDLLPRYQQQADESTRGPEGQRTQTYYGTTTLEVVGAQPAATGDGYELNFENTPVTTVAKVILGDILQAGYIIDPRVQGTVSLASGRPVQKTDILYVLESALRTSNVALVREGRNYRLVPAAEAIGSGAVDPTGRVEAGYGITVMPLQYVSAQTLIKLMDSFAAKPGAVRADPARNMVVIQGTSAERRAAIETVVSFDADWMRGQSVGIFPVRNSTPEPIITELERIMDAGEGGLSQSLVKLQPIARQNAILVVARKPELLRTTGVWIARLDTSDAASTAVKVYRLKYGDARQVAALLNDIFTGRGSGGGFDSPTNQLAPGGGLATASSGGGFSGAGGFSGPGGAGGIASGSQGFTGSPALSAAGVSPRGQAAAAAAGDPAALGTNLLASRTVYGAGTSAFGGGGAGGPGVLPGVRITADVVNNSLLIYANQENYQIIERTLRQLDRPQLQVSIDATIAEITLNNNLSYGVQFFLKSKDVGLGPDKGSVINSATATSAVLGRVLPGFNFLAGSEASPKVILDALHGITDVKVLSTPSVVVIDNQVATLQVGDQVPIATRTAQAVDVPTAPIVNSIDYRNTGVILRVVPRINVNGNVLLDIEQEISNVANTANANTLTPTVSQRKVKSSIAVASGQTVLLAGLISERQDRGRSGIPGLMQIPGIGEVFSSNTGNTQRTEIIIFIRPQIIRDSLDAARVAQELRSKMRGTVGTAEPMVPLAPRNPYTSQQ
jgi:general secretion pathway protein D